MTYVVKGSKSQAGIWFGPARFFTLKPAASVAAAVQLTVVAVNEHPDTIELLAVSQIEVVAGVGNEHETQMSVTVSVGLIQAAVVAIAVAESCTLQPTMEAQVLVEVVVVRVAPAETVTPIELVVAQRDAVAVSHELGSGE